MNLPHTYSANASAEPQNPIQLSATGLPGIVSEPPKEFGGSGDHWSPEDLLVAAVADCFVLSFRAISQASKYGWVDLQCDVKGTLDKVERAIQFTGFEIQATLTIGADADPDRAQRLLEKSKQACFITNSLKAEATLNIEVKQA